MARKTSQRKRSGEKRSLTARKTHFKNVSNAMLENTSFHREASVLNAEPLKKGFETHVPRKVREMRAAMQRVKDMEAGKHVAWRPHREDVPKPKHERVPKRKRAEAGAAADVEGEEDAVDAAAPEKAWPSKKQRAMPVTEEGQLHAAAVDADGGELMLGGLCTQLL